MATKLSIFTTATDPILRGDLWHEPITCYEKLADEVVVVNGGGILPLRGFRDHLNIKVVQSPWNREFSWEFIGEQFQRGYEETAGDWVLRADLDMIWHEKDYAAIRQACEDNPEAPALSFYKWQFVLPDRYNLKSRLVLLVNKKKYGDRIRFDSGGDLCQVSLDNKYLTPDDVPQVGIQTYNYEKILKSESQIKNDVGRMARAWKSHFGEYRLGGPDDESAYAEWLKMEVGRFNKPSEHIKLEDHPAVMQNTIRNLKPEQFGYSGFGQLTLSDYVS